MIICHKCGYKREDENLVCRICGHESNLDDTPTSKDDSKVLVVDLSDEGLKNGLKTSGDTFEESTNKDQLLERFSRKSTRKSRIYLLTVLALCATSVIGVRALSEPLVEDPVLLPACITILTTIISLIGILKPKFFAMILFIPIRIMRFNEIYRLITSGFGHINLSHLILNLYALIMFGPYLMSYLIGSYGLNAPVIFLLIYLSAILMADLPDLIRKRNDSSFKSIGASGAISAVIAGSVVAEPNLQVTLAFLPSSTAVPGFIYIVIFLGLSLYLDFKSIGKIAHIAHVSGTIYGLGLLSLISTLNS